MNISETHSVLSEKQFQERIFTYLDSQNVHITDPSEKEHSFYNQKKIDFLGFVKT